MTFSDCLTSNRDFFNFNIFSPLQQLREKTFVEKFKHLSGLCSSKSYHGQHETAHTHELRFDLAEISVKKNPHGMLSPLLSATKINKRNVCKHFEDFHKAFLLSKDFKRNADWKINKNLIISVVTAMETNFRWKSGRSEADKRMKGAFEEGKSFERRKAISWKV